MLTSTSFGVESKPDNPVLRAVWVPGDRGCSWCAARSSSSHNCPLQPGWLQALEVVCGRGGSGGFPGQGSVKNHRFSFSEFYLPSPEKANLCKPLILKYQRALGKCPPSSECSEKLQGQIKHLAKEDLKHHLYLCCPEGRPCPAVVSDAVAHTERDFISVSATTSFSH